jgi:hypothetical protein
MKSIKISKFDEKRAITPKWVITKCEVAKAKFLESLTFMFFYSNVDNLH